MNPVFRHTVKILCKGGLEQEISWGHYAIGDDIPGLNKQMVTDYIRYLGNLRWTSLAYPPLSPYYESESASMEWVSRYANAATWVKLIFLRQGGRSTKRVRH